MANLREILRLITSDGTATIASIHHNHATDRLGSVDNVQHHQSFVSLELINDNIWEESRPWCIE
jgi:hypothetical protein